MKNLSVIVLCTALALSCGAHAQTKPAPEEKGGLYVPALPARPQGVYATIDLRTMNEILVRLQTAGQRNTAAREVIKNPSVHMPPVLYVVANVLSGDRPEEAIFWYNVGRVRAVYDAFRCKDATSHNLIPVLGQTLSVELRRSLYFYRDTLVAIAQKAIEWDAQHPRDYDQRWVCLYGRVAQTSAGADPAEMQKPENEWPSILLHVHEAHLKGVQDFVAQPAPTR